MYIRMMSGREPGSVVDMRDEEAKAMLADGRAVKIDFDAANPFETRTHFTTADQQAQILPDLSTSAKTRPAQEPAIAASGAEPKKSRRK